MRKIFFFTLRNHQPVFQKFLKFLNNQFKNFNIGKMGQYEASSKLNWAMITNACSASTL